MKNAENPEPAERRSDFTWPALVGLALFLAGVSESLRSLWRLAEGENALPTLIFCLACTAAGVWLFRREKRKQR